MPSTGLHGPHNLNADTIDAYVGTSIGTYALGYVSDGGTFIVNYTGRSDTDLNDRLKDWIGNYKSFKYGHYSTAKAAYECECRIFHDFGGTAQLDNSVHPARPKGTDWKCPRGDCF